MLIPGNLPKQVCIEVAQSVQVIPPMSTNREEVPEREGGDAEKREEGPEREEEGPEREEEGPEREKGSEEARLSS